MTSAMNWHERSLALVALGAEEAELATYLARRMRQASLHVHASVEAPLTEQNAPGAAEHTTAAVIEWRAFDKIAHCLSELFGAVQGIVVVAPIGVTVRSIAPLLRSKLTDPAIVGVDACGRYAVSLLSGHEGGANELSLLVADLLDAQPVVTTTTEAKKRIVVGVGCRRGTLAEELVAAIREALERSGLELDSVRWIVSAEVKRDEPGLREAASRLGLPLRFVRVEDLRRWALSESAWVRRTFDLPAVAEPAALLCGTRTRCLMPKTVIVPGITLAIAEETLPWSGSARAALMTEPGVPSEPFDLPT